MKRIRKGGTNNKLFDTDKTEEIGLLEPNILKNLSPQEREKLLLVRKTQKEDLEKKLQSEKQNYQFELTQAQTRKENDEKKNFINRTINSIENRFDESQGLKILGSILKFFTKIIYYIVVCIYKIFIFLWNAFVFFTNTIKYLLFKVLLKSGITIADKIVRYSGNVVYRTLDLSVNFFNTKGLAVIIKWVLFILFILCILYYVFGINVFGNSTSSSDPIAYLLRLLNSGFNSMTNDITNRYKEGVSGITDIIGQNNQIISISEFNSENKNMFNAPLSILSIIFPFLNDLKYYILDSRLALQTIITGKPPNKNYNFFDRDKIDTGRVDDIYNIEIKKYNPSGEENKIITMSEPKDIELFIDPSKYNIDYNKLPESIKNDTAIDKNGESTLLSLKDKLKLNIKYVLNNSTGIWDYGINDIKYKYNKDILIQINDNQKIINNDYNVIKVPFVKDVNYFS